MPLPTPLSQSDIDRMVTRYQEGNLSIRMLASAFRINIERCKKILQDEGVYDGQNRLKKSRRVWGKKY